jgi:hypothetical protein
VPLFCEDESTCENDDYTVTRASQAGVQKNRLAYLRWQINERHAINCAAHSNFNISNWPFFFLEVIRKNTSFLAAPHIKKQNGLLQLHYQYPGRDFQVYHLHFQPSLCGKKIELTEA